MFFTTKFSSALSALALVATAANAIVIPTKERFEWFGKDNLSKRTVWDPPVLSPQQGDVWTVGQKKLVRWNNTAPEGVTSSEGKLILGYLSDSSQGEHLDLDSPLASGFNLSDGKVEITVPDVKERDSYIVVLMGDSGNASPEFTIQKASGDSNALSASTSASVDARDGDAGATTVTDTFYSTTTTSQEATPSTTTTEAVETSSIWEPSESSSASTQDSSSANANAVAVPALV